MSQECPQLQRFEREVYEAWGIVPEGHPWLKPVRYTTPASGAERPGPAQCDHYRVEGGQVHEVAVGPVHAGIIEPGHFRFQCYGENVLNLEISLGFQHRGVEKMLAGGPHLRDAALMECVAGDTSVGHCTAYSVVLERLAGVSVPLRAQLLRRMGLEFERLANHTGDLGAIAGDTGFLPTSSWNGRIRGDFLNMTAEICGNRFGRGLVCPGGVNDVLALREADCSIAMASGSGVACQASHIVLLDSQFSALPSVVAEGRRVINNIERSASLYLVKNIFTFVLSLITLFFTLPYPYTPAQLSLVNALTIGIPSFILAMEPNENRISGRFMPNVIYRALPAALSDLILVVGVMLFYLAFHIKEDMLSTLCTGIMGIVGLLMIHQTSLPLNKLRKAMLIGLCAAFVVCYFFLPELFTLSALDNPSLLILVVLGLLAFSVMFVCRRGLRKAKARLNKGIFPRRKKR